MELREIIKSKRGTMTQTAFAAKIGATRNTVIAWEAGRLKPSAKFMETLGITVRYEVRA